MSVRHIIFCLFVLGCVGAASFSAGHAAGTNHVWGILLRSRTLRLAKPECLSAKDRAEAPAKVLKKAE